MLELGKAGTAGTEKGVVPVLRDGAVVATLRASNWKDEATAVVGRMVWVYTKRRGVLTARWTADPEGTARLTARQTSSWRGTWVADLEGAHLEIGPTSLWRGTRRHTVGGRPVAESGTTGGWSPRPTLTTAPGMPVEHAVFLLWLELVISRRTNAAVAAGAGAAVIGGTT